jgi:hypothetical protein
MGIRVAKIAIESGQPERALELLDLVDFKFGEPPPKDRPDQALTRFVAEVAAGKLSVAETQGRTHETAKQYRQPRDQKPWTPWREGASLLVGASDLLARGKTNLAQEFLDLARDPVTLGTHGIPGDPAHGLEQLLEWTDLACGPGPHVRREMTAVMQELDQVGAATEAAEAQRWLREGPDPERPPPPVIGMGFLGYYPRFSYVERFRAR